MLKQSSAILRALSVGIVLCGGGSRNSKYPAQIVGSCIMALSKSSLQCHFGRFAAVNLHNSTVLINKAL